MQTDRLAEIDAVAPPVVLEKADEHRVPKWRFDQVLAQKKELQKELQKVNAALELSTAQLELVTEQRDQLFVRLELATRTKR
jgi:hypothetical protein